MPTSSVAEIVSVTLVEVVVAAPELMLIVGLEGEFVSVVLPVVNPLEVSY